MRKVIKLTESDLIQIINKVLNEQLSNVVDTKKEIIKFQQILVNLGYDLGTSGPQKNGVGGYIGPMTRNAIKDFQSKNNLNPTGDLDQTTQNELSLIGMDTKKFGPKLTGKVPFTPQKTKKTTTPIKPTNPKLKTKTPQTGGFIMVFAFPDYRPSAGDSWVNRNILAPITNTLFEDGGSLFGVGGGSGSNSSGGSVKMGKVGHGGCVIIQPDGTTGLFEFGRYESDDYGVVRKRNLGKIAKISNGKLLNAKQVAKIAKSKTQGEGPRLRMDVAVIPLPNPKGALQYADVKGTQEYTVADPAQGGAKNCGTYALEVAIEGGVNTSFSCFASPRGVVDHVRPLAVETFEV